MQAQASRPKTTDITKLNSSVAVMKNSIRIALSSIAFQRGLFPMDLFVPKEYCGVNLMVLKPTTEENGKKVCKDRNAQLLLDTLEKGVFDAFQHQYCDRIMINIHDKNPFLENSDGNSSILECYSFRVSYTTDSKIKLAQESKGKDSGKELITTEKILGQTRMLIRSLSCAMGGLPQLPNKTWVTFYLSYTKNTPVSYEPPLFEATALDTVPVFRSAPLPIKVGSAQTLHHDLCMKLRHCYGNTNGPQSECETIVASDEEGNDVYEDEIPPHQDHTMENWESYKDSIFESFKKMVLAKPKTNPRTILENSEWGYSMSDKLKDDFMERLHMSTSGANDTPEENPLREITGSQDSLRDDRENITKLSRSKRPVESNTSSSERPSKSSKLAKR